MVRWLPGGLHTAAVIASAAFLPASVPATATGHRADAARAR
ncbi:hypothetical protein OG780_43865 [Streptomyces sp. NBC_00386]